MNPAVWMLFGAAALAVVWGVYVGSRKVVTTVAALVSALTRLDEAVKLGREMVASNRQLAEMGRQVALELQTLRSLMESQAQPPAPDAGATGDGDAPAPTRPRNPRQIPPFPLPSYDNFVPIAYEAKEDETDIISTSDEELSEFEKLEEVRRNGFEAESAETPEELQTGVMKEAQP